VGKYSLELWNGGQLVADLTGRASGRSLIKSRNEADEITWSIKLDEFERYCRLLKLDPQTLLINGQTEVRIRRGQKYLGGGQLIYHETHLAAEGPTISVRVTGFLNLFKFRYTDAERIFTGVNRSTIVSTLITETQTGDNRDFGVTIGNLAAGNTHDETYKRENIKAAIQAQTKRQTDPIDIEITADKVFNSYSQIGSQRPDVLFEYPGNLKPGSVVPSDATDLANRVIVLGSGFGELALAQTVVEDLGSQANYKVREEVVLSNAKDDVAELEDDGRTVLAARAFPMQVPRLKVDGNKPPYITDYGIGDWVMVRINGYQWLRHINALYRVEKFVLTVDEDDNENIDLQVSR
jgi:hypothetical protein